LALLLIGLNHRTTPVELREKLYLTTEQLYPVLNELQQQSVVILESAMLSTCNRLEVYCAVRDVVAAKSAIMHFLCQHYGLSETILRTHLYIKQGRLAIQHLMRVAAGLDSMILGESQILGQVGDALRCATTVSTTGTYLHRLFEQAIHAGKRARTETAISQNTTSVSHAAALLIRNRVMQLAPRVLVIGAGEMAQLAAQAASDYGIQQIAVINRTYDHAQALAEKIDGIAFEWSRLWDQLAAVDVVITATGAPHTVLYADDMRRVVEQRQGRNLLMVDVAVPRDIDPAVDDLDGITCYDIDDLQQVVDDSLAQREACIPAVEAIIAEEAEKYWQWLNERNIVPVIKDLRREIQSVVQTELEDALNKLAHLDDGEQEVVKRLAHRIMNKVLHAPTASLREQAANGDSESYATVVRDLFALSQDEIQT